MKTLLLIFTLFLILYSPRLLSQINPREYDKNYMQTIFEDDFNGSTINRDIWEPGLIHRGIGQLIDSSLTHNVSNGKLGLTMVNIPNYNDSSNYVGGEFSTKETFLYGSFECQATFAKEIGSWPAFWSFHRQPCPNNDGPEIDFAEYSCHTPLLKNLGHYVHHWNASPCGGPGNGSTNVYEKEYNFTASTNIYKCYWTPEKIEFYLNGYLKGVYNRNGVQWWPSVPVAVILSQQILQPYNILGQPIVPVSPQTSYFNYVKVKSFFLAPEITCPSVICSTTTATLDVDEDATNITWTLTPGNLFSGATSGSGTSAPIVPSSYYHGLGKITFNFDMPSGESFSIDKEFRISGPAYEDISFEVYKSTGELANNYGGSWVMCPNTTYHIYVNNDGPCSTSNYSWTIPSAWTRHYTYQNMISINTNSTPGGNVIVEANTCCNNNKEIISEYMGTDYNCGYYYMTFTPNPATSETTVELFKGSQSDNTVVSSAVTKELLTEEWEIDVFGQNQALKSSNKKIKGNKYKINVRGWKKGVYFVRAKVGGEIVLGKFLVED